MPTDPTLNERAHLLATAQSRWINEGGAAPGVTPSHGSADPRAALEAAAFSCADGPPQTNAEIVQLKVRVIALENLLIALLSEASPGLLALAEEMAGSITPRPGATPHRLTVQGAAHMRWVVERAQILRAQAGQPPQSQP